MPDSRPTMAVVVVNYGSHQLLQENLVPLARAQEHSLTVVVDNLTTTTERSAVCALAERERWSTVLPDANLGFGAGVNTGVARARELGATSFLLLNPDATLDTTSVARLRDGLAADPWSVRAPVIRKPDGSVWSAGHDLDLERGGSTARGRHAPDDPSRIEPWVSGACLMLGSELWDALGGFDEDYFLYWEDVDLSVRATRLGARLVVDGDATAVHDEGGTHSAARSSARAKSTVYYYYNIRNRLVFAGKLLDATDLRRWRRSAVPAAYRVLLEGGRRQFLSPAGAVGAAVRGIRDGWATTSGRRSGLRSDRGAASRPASG